MVRTSNRCCAADHDRQLGHPGCHGGVLLATKLEAFRGRGRKDYRGSHDLEDVIAVVDGRPELLQEVAEAPDDVRTYIATEARKLLDTRAFVDALPGFLLPDSASQGRVPLLVERLTTVAQSAR